MAIKNSRSSTLDNRPVATALPAGQQTINTNAASPGVYFRASDNSLVKVGPIHVGSTAPNAAPAGSAGNSKGEAWLDTSGASPVLKIWDGSAWQAGVVPDGDINVASINAGPLAGFRNAIINGNFDIWQRGTSFTATGYTADRWANSNNVGGSRSITRETFTPGQGVVPNEPAYYLRWEQTVGGDGVNVTNDLIQKIEGVRTFAGQEVTFSFWARSSTGVTITSPVSQNFGSGGSSSVSFDPLLSAAVPADNTWRQYSWTDTIPSISGKTIAGGDDFVISRFRFPNSGTFIADIAQVQLEIGPIATPFEQRPIGVERALCERYYLTVTGSAGGGFGRKYASAAGSTYFNNAITYSMRAVPTFTWNTPTLENCTTITASLFDDGATVRVNPSAAGAYQAYGGAMTFDAEL